MSALSHLDWLEAESIHVMREVAAECDNPVMLFSIGKDSAVMLHLAIKAFYPGRLPFPLLHIDTTWKFREMIAFRDRCARELGFELIVHVNQDGLARGINPFDHGSRLYTDVMKTQALKQALAKWNFEGAHLLVPHQRASLGSAKPAAGILAALQYPQAREREHPSVPPVELDGVRRLGLHRAGKHPGGAALFCRAPPGGAARRFIDHGR